MDELLTSLSSQQITEWMAFLSLEPLPHEQAAMYAAQTAHTIAAVNMKNPPKLTKFVLDFAGEDKPDDEAARVDKMGQAFAAMIEEAKNQPRVTVPR